MLGHGVGNLGMVLESSEKLADERMRTGNSSLEEEGHLQRPKHPTTYLESLAHQLKGSIASGMYAMGDAFKNGGMLLSPILTVYLGVTCVFNQHILVNCSDIMREKNKLNYYIDFEDTVELCFGAGPPLLRKYAGFSRSAVSFFILTAQMGFCCVYIVFVTKTAAQVLHYLNHEIEFHLLMILTLVLVLGFVLIRNLKFIAPVSLFATVVMVVGIAMTVYLSMDDLPPISTRRAFTSLDQLPLFFGTVVYAYEGISLVLPLHIEMKHPEQFIAPLGVLNVGNTIVTLLLLTVGSVGYLKYGDDVKGSLTLNLPPDNEISQCVKIAVAIGMLLTYPIMFYVPVALTWQAMVRRWGPFERPAKYQYALRITLCFLTFVLAELVPNLSLFISLVGAVSSTALALVFPPLCDICVRWEDNNFGTLSWRKLVDCMSLVLAFFGFCTGTYFSILQIVRTFGNID